MAKGTTYRANSSRTGPYVTLMAHHHLIGQGHETLVQSLIHADLSHQYQRYKAREFPRQLFVLDPNGQTVDWLLDYIPRQREVVLCDPREPIAWNPLSDVTDIPAVASSIVDTFRAINGYDISANLFNKALYSAVSAILEANGTLFEVKYFFLSDKLRRDVLKRVHNPIIKRFWEGEYVKLSPRERNELIRSAETTFHILISDPRIAAILAQPKSTFSLADLDVFLATIPQGAFGIQRSATVGSLLLGQLLATVQRHPYEDLRVYVLDCHYFAPQTLIELLQTGHKYGVSLTLCHGTLSQLDLRLKDTLLGLAATRHVFRVSQKDADELESLVEHDNTNPRLNELAPGVYRTYPITDKKTMDKSATLPSTLPKERARERVLKANERYRKPIDIQRLVEGM